MILHFASKPGKASDFTADFWDQLAEQTAAKECEEQWDFEAHLQAVVDSNNNTTTAPDLLRDTLPVASTSKVPYHSIGQKSPLKKTVRFVNEEAATIPTSMPIPIPSTGSALPPLQPQLPRTAFTVADFTTPFANSVQIERWFSEFECLSKRNFYLLHNHHATAAHYDLRIQLDDATLSFAIPKGLEDWPLNDRSKSTSGIRLAVETDFHPISYTLFEGGGIGTTGVWDLGAYKIIPNKSASRKKKELERRGFNGDTTTDSEGSEPDSGSLIYKGKRKRKPTEMGDSPASDDADYKEENLLRAAYQRAAHIITKTTSDGQILYPARGDDSDSFRGFTIELNGARYKGMQLNFKRRGTDLKITTPRNTPKDQMLRITHRKWMVSLSSPHSTSIGNPQYGDRSITSNRTMAEIKASRGTEISTLAQSQWSSYMPPPEEGIEFTREFQENTNLADLQLMTGMVIDVDKDGWPVVLTEELDDQGLSNAGRAFEGHNALLGIGTSGNNEARQEEELWESYSHLLAGDT